MKKGESDEEPTMKLSELPPVLNYWDRLSVKQQLAEIKKNWHSIKHIKNPSEELQLAAVKQSGNALEYIENPSETVQLVAVRQNGWAVHYITNPSETVQKMAIWPDIYAIKSIKNPTPSVQMEVVRAMSRAIEFIDNPTEEAIKTAFTDEKFIKDSPTSYEVQVKRVFKGNTLLMKKWLRYGEAMRNQE
jgi:hypothetical protein